MNANLPNFEMQACLCFLLVFSLEIKLFFVCFLNNEHCGVHWTLEFGLYNVLRLALLYVFLGAMSMVNFYEYETLDSLCLDSRLYGLCV
jgi:hypothetical protein